MRFVNGGPKQVYLLIDQETGVVVLYNTKDGARRGKKVVESVLRHKPVILTYVQKGA